MPDMIDFRFNFPVIYLDNKLYVLGGRQFGDKDVALMNKCEFFDFELMTWKSMPRMTI